MRMAEWERKYVNYEARWHVIFVHSCCRSLHFCPGREASSFWPDSRTNTSSCSISLCVWSVWQHLPPMNTNILAGLVHFGVGNELLWNNLCVNMGRHTYYDRLLLRYSILHGRPKTFTLAGFIICMLRCSPPTQEDLFRQHRRLASSLYVYVLRSNNVHQASIMNNVKIIKYEY